MKKVKYRITSKFALEAKGAIVNAYLFAKQDDQAMLYFPKDEVGCACIVICKETSKDTYEEVDQEAFINLEGRSAMNKKLLSFLESERYEKFGDV